MDNERLFDPSGFSTRLRDLIYPEKYGHFAERAGISLSVLNKYLAGKEELNPSVDVVARICEATQSSMDWLILGKGDSPAANDKDQFQIPIYDVRLAAGSGSFLEREKRIGEMPVDGAFLRSLGLSSTEGLGVVQAEGDSMMPRISDGARVLICLADKKDNRLAEGIYAFRLGDQLRIKRLRPIGLGGVEAISENPIYAPERLEGEVMQHFELLGRALWAGTIL